MSDLENGQREEVTISVERMMRFCYLAEMLFECSDSETKVLPLHLTPFGTLLLETSSFLYSLFEQRTDSINLVRMWQGFDHPFANDLREHARRLDAFKADLKLVRDRLGFHGSITRSHERVGLGVFDVESGRARDFARLVRDMQRLFLRMIAWYMEKMESTIRPADMFKEFFAELKRLSRVQGAP